MLAAASLDSNPPILLTESTEAEAIKLFANTYLALRVSYFNEMDTFAAVRGLDARAVIVGRDATACGSCGCLMGKGKALQTGL